MLGTKIELNPVKREWIGHRKKKVMKSRRITWQWDIYLWRSCIDVLYTFLNERSDQKERQIDRCGWKRVPEWSRLMEESRWIGIIIVLQSRDLSLMPVCCEHVATRRGNHFSIPLHWDSNVYRIKLDILRFYNLWCKIDKNWISIFYYQI